MQWARCGGGDESEAIGAPGLRYGDGGRVLLYAVKAGLAGFPSAVPVGEVCLGGASAGERAGADDGRGGRGG